jgi:NodT family efflux transporter outer membrane factor (OMF) lipoprotein
LPSELLARRPDVLYAEQQLVEANADITVARAALFPSISLTGSFGYQSSALKNLFSPTSMLWSLGSSVTQSIFHGGALEGSVEYKRARYDELVANYRKAVLSAFIDVDNALNAAQKTDQLEAAQRRAAETARRAYELSLDQFRGGVADITTVLNTEKSLFIAEDTLVQARLSHLEAVVSLYKALGGGWDGTI